MQFFLQSTAWEKTQTNLGKQTFYRTGDGWSFVAILETRKSARYLYLPHGPIANSPQCFQVAMQEVKKIAQTQKCLFVRFEPCSESIYDGTNPSAFLTQYGYVKAPHNIQPEATQIIELNDTPEAILANMNASNRNLTRNIHKKGVTFRKSQNPDDIEYLLKLLADTAKRNDFTPQSDHYLRTVAQTILPLNAGCIFLAEIEDKVIGAALCYDSSDTRIYAHAATDFAYRKLKLGNPLVANLILDAQKNGLKYVDLFGITLSEDPAHPWAGFTTFKRSFGGQTLIFPGTWDMPINKLGYRLYLASLKAKKIATKLKRAK